MKKICAAIFGGVLAMAFLNTPASADNFQGGLRSPAREIRQGAASGELTFRETQILLRDLYRLRTVYHRAALDGRLSPFERNRIQRLRATLDRRIQRLENNRRHRAPERTFAQRGQGFHSNRPGQSDSRWDTGDRRSRETSRPPSARRGQSGWKPL